MVNRYVRQVMLASHVSPKVHNVILDVQHLLAPPSAIFRPVTLARTLRAARRSPAHGQAAPLPGNAPAKPEGAPLDRTI
jgi:hypothetical protein